MSQDQLAEATGYSQSNIGWIEAGKPKRPERVALALAPALQTTVDWLLHEKGPKHVGPVYLPAAVMLEKYESLPAEFKAEVTIAMEKAIKSITKKRA